MYNPIYEKSKRDKAVSPIIATILIVAITVVLAATLYAVIGGYGGLIGKSTPSASFTVTKAGTTYTVSVTSVSGTLTFGDVQVKITEGSSGTYTSAVLSSATTVGATGATYNITVTSPSSTPGPTVAFNSTAAFTLAPTGTETPGAITAIALIDQSTGGTIYSWTS